jgi:hypothetical protein
VPEPNDATVLGCDLHIRKDAEGTISLSGGLAELLVHARSDYAWRGSPSASQQCIIDLERRTHQRLESLDDEKAHWIIQQVSLCGGNWVSKHRALDQASPAQKKKFAGLIQELLSTRAFEKALNGLSAKPSLHLVMATKIYRFCWPEGGAAGCPALFPESHRMMKWVPHPFAGFAKGWERSPSTFARTCLEHFQSRCIGDAAMTEPGSSVVCGDARESLRNRLLQRLGGSGFERT